MNRNTALHFTSFILETSSRMRWWRLPQCRSKLVPVSELASRQLLLLGTMTVTLVLVSNALVRSQLPSRELLPTQSSLFLPFAVATGEARYVWEVFYFEKVCIQCLIHRSGNPTPYPSRLPALVAPFLCVWSQPLAELALLPPEFRRSFWTWLVLRIATLPLLARPTPWVTLVCYSHGHGLQIIRRSTWWFS